MDKELRQKISHELQIFGRVKIIPYDFSNPQEPILECIEMVADKKLADGLETEINSHLRTDAGYQAFIRFIDIHEERAGKFIYAAEIIPYDFVPRQQWAEATEQALSRVLSIIRSYKMKHKR